MFVSDLAKALDKNKLVQVPVQVKGKTGIFTRQQWKKIGDLTPDEAVAAGITFAKKDDDKKQSGFRKADEKFRQMVDDLAKQLGDEKLLEGIKARGIQWKENSHAGINKMHAKMRLREWLEDGNVWENSGAKTSPKPKVEPKKVEPPKPKLPPREQRFQDALDNLPETQQKVCKKLGIAASDEAAAEYLQKSLLPKYVTGVGDVYKTISDKLDAVDEFRGVVNVTLVKKIKNVMDKNFDRRLPETEVRAIWSNWRVNEHSMGQAKVKGQWSGNYTRRTIQNQVDFSNDMIIDTLDKLASSKDYPEAKEFSKAYKKLNDMCNNNAMAVRAVIEAHIESAYQRKNILEAVQKSIDTTKSGIEHSSKVEGVYKESYTQDLQVYLKILKDANPKVPDKAWKDYVKYFEENMPKYDALGWQRTEKEVLKGVKDFMARRADIPASSLPIFLPASDNTLNSYASRVVSDWSNWKSPVPYREYQKKMLEAYEIASKVLGDKRTEGLYTELNDRKYHKIHKNLQLLGHVINIAKSDMYGWAGITEEEIIDRMGILSKKELEGNVDSIIYRAGALKPSIQKKAGDNAEAHIQALHEQNLKDATTYLNLSISELRKEVEKRIDSNVKPGTSEYKKMRKSAIQSLVAAHKSDILQDVPIKCSLTTVSNQSQEYKKIVNDFYNSRDRRTHGGMNIKVHGVYKIADLPGEEDFNQLKKTKGNIKNLYHGTGAMATSLILGQSGGFKIADVKAGRMLGDGIYLADRSSKSAQYVHDERFTRHKANGTIFICESIMGKVAPWSRYFDTSCDTVEAKAGSGVQNNEWCVKDPKAVRPRYLIHVEV